MERVPCKKCGVGILPSTAKATEGFCMPCAKGEVSGFEQALEKRKSEAPGRRLEPGEWIKAIVLGVPMILGMMLVFLVLKIAIAVAVALVARYLFGAGWNTASFLGVITYLLINLVGALGDLGPPNSHRGKDDRN